MISCAKFRVAVGWPPENDDMERCNCERAGQIGHFLCGWCDSCDLPRFLCGHQSVQQSAPP